LIDVSNGVMGALLALGVYYTVSSFQPLVKGEPKANDPEAQPALGAVSLSTPEVEAAVPDERICDFARKYGTMADMPSSGPSRLSSLSTQGQSNSTSNLSPQITEVAQELNSLANEPA